MQQIRKLMYKPRPDDWSPVAKFFYADEELQEVANELDSFDGRKDTERCTQLVHRLRQCQDRVLQIIEEMMNENFPSEGSRTARDFRVKFPDDILHDNLPGQLWFGAECLAAGSNIIDHEAESEAIRPLAKSFVCSLDKLRYALKDQSMKDPSNYSDKIVKYLRNFDAVFAEFELNYVSAMVPVKTQREYDLQLDTAVLFSETLIRAIKYGYITAEQVEDCDPNMLIHLPRLAIVGGLIVYPKGPLNVDREKRLIPEMFQHFRDLLIKIRNLLRALTQSELATLERTLCSQAESSLESPPGAVSMKPERLVKASKSRSAEEDSSSSSRDDSPEPDEVFQDLHHCLATSPGDDVNFMISSPSNNSVEMSTGSVETHYTSTDDVTGGGGGGASMVTKSPANVLISVSQPAPINADSLHHHRDSSSSGVADFEISYHNLPSTKDRNAKSTTSKHSSLRAKFESADDLIHRLFVCIAGVADQLQTNYPSDLRAILKMVLQEPSIDSVYEINGVPSKATGREEEVGVEAQESPTSEMAPDAPDNGLPQPMLPGSVRGGGSNHGLTRPPAQHATAVPSSSTTTANSTSAQNRETNPVIWQPDGDCSQCCACGDPFTMLRRRHHCRKCGKIFCQRCSTNSVILPSLGYQRPVRVCNQCFFYQLDPFDNQNNNSTSAVVGES